MSNLVKFQVAILASLFGFFIGGIINVNKEIIEIFLSAIIGGIVVFFIVFYFLNVFLKKEKNSYNENNKGKKIDITIDNSEEIINNYLNK